ncbi:MAG: hypothetical protein N4A44_03635 [Alphaproteobacteria bacterium]|jgi:hypothetical protein|nr:hypothetical protein [Alphaproteobacteria bacterium]
MSGKIVIFVSGVLFACLVLVIYYRLFLKRQHDADLEVAELEIEDTKALLNMISKALIENEFGLNFFNFLERYNVLPLLNRSFLISFRFSLEEVNIIKSVFDKVRAYDYVNWTHFKADITSDGKYKIDGGMRKGQFYFLDPVSGERVYILDISKDIEFKKTLELLSENRGYKISAEK